MKIDCIWLKIFLSMEFKKFDINSFHSIIFSSFLDLAKFLFFNFINFLLYLPSLLLPILLFAFSLLLTPISPLLPMVLLSGDLVLNVQISRITILLKS